MAIMFTFSFLLFATVVTLWLQLSLLMSIVNVNLCWLLAVNKVVNCVLLVCVHHLAKATLQHPVLLHYYLLYRRPKSAHDSDTAHMQYTYPRRYVTSSGIIWNTEHGRLRAQKL